MSKDIFMCFQRQLWHQSRFFRTLSILVLKPSQDRDCIRSLGSLSTWLVSWARIFCLYYIWTLSVSSQTQRPSFSYQASLWSSRLHLPDNLSIGIGDDVRWPKPSVFQLNPPSSLSPSSQDQCSSPKHHTGPTLNLLWFIDDLLYWRSPNTSQYPDII